MAISAQIQQKFRALFGADYRSLAAFRIGLGVILVCDLFYRALFLRAHYTDLGVLPRSVVIDEFPPWHISFHLVSGLAAVQALLFAVHLVAALALLFGFRTKTALFAAWLLTISLHGRNPLLLQGGDVLFRLLMFWGLFLPLGAIASVDALQRRAAAPKSTIGHPLLSVATFSMSVQFILLYYFNYLYKQHPPWTEQGTAIYQALSLDQFATSIGIWLRQFPELLAALTRPTLLFEGFGAALLFIPFFTAQFRLVGIAAFALMHLAFWACLELGPFPFVNLLFLVFFLPPISWERIGDSSAKLFSWWFALLGWLANCLPQPGSVPEWQKRRPLRFVLVDLLPALFLTSAVVFTIEAYRTNGALPRWADQICSLVRIDQKWNMFAPPLTEDGWYVMPAKLVDGRNFDIFPAAMGSSEMPAVEWSKPEDGAARYRSERWRKYFMNLWDAGNRKQWLHFGRYLCRAWNETHEKRELLESFEIYFVLERTSLETQTPPTERVLLWQHYCFSLPE